MLSVIQLFLRLYMIRFLNKETRIAMKKRSSYRAERMIWKLCFKSNILAIQRLMRLDTRQIRLPVISNTTWTIC